ncbi:benzoate 4-monooxygenase cytochrome P450 [Clohesyomyces aquaticus]|uniref:Benzoate 4-monooxygenase cytochrome P450 n=1 Tax=Clohesyomyces aquaticus TaxID=1231657 RepID=A0A1Y1Y8B2_9PLEO|nr:benzoate 4-monooxygenase cytochrome P450 [Clohesyomyces aquaticus]
MAILKLPVPPTPNFLLFLVTGAILYLILLCIYRVYLHPLSKYPGPISYKLSGWPLLWQAYKGDRHIWHLKDHENYGPIVRIAPNTLSFNTSSALNTIYGSRVVNVKKGEWYKTFDIAAGTYSSFTETDKEKHAAKRRWMSPAFSDTSQKINEPIINDIIERFCETIGQKKGTRDDDGGWGGKWNASVEATYLGFDIMGALVFGTDFKTVQEDKNRAIADSILPASKFLYWISYLPMAVLVRPLLRTRLFEIVGGKPIEDNNRLIDYASSEVAERGKEKEKETASDFLSHLYGKVDWKTRWRPTRADLDVECLNMMNAGADPYSSVLAGAIFYLVHNEPVRQKLVGEIRTTFPSPSEIHSGPLLTSCTYLSAFIEETLRRTAPVPSHLPRVILPGGLTIDSQPLPSGTVVGVSAYSIHHNALYHPSPFTFSPERWIPSASNPESTIDAAKRAFEPFGLGSRACVGKNLAYLQLRLTLAHLIWRFDVRECEEERGVGGGREGLGVGREREDEFQLWDALGFGRDGPVVQVRRAAR